MNEWTDDLDAMVSALIILNRLILNLPECEESARNEAERVKRKFKSWQLDKDRAAIVDHLKQATIDYEANAKRQK